MLHHFPKRPRQAVLRDWLITLGLLLLCCGLSSLLLMVDSSGGFISMLFVLAVVLTARLTEGYIFGVAASFVGVICVNYVFTYPYWEFNFTISGYPLTFLTMFTVSLIVSALTSQIKRQEQLRVETDREAMRANLLRAVSHDLRTPLTSIVGSTSAILENEARLEPDQKTALLRNVRDEAQWLIRMVENLLSITRMGDDDAHIDKELEAAEEVLASVSGKFQQRFPGVRLELAVPQELLFIPMADEPAGKRRIPRPLYPDPAVREPPGGCGGIHCPGQRRGDSGGRPARHFLPRPAQPDLRLRQPEEYGHWPIGMQLHCQGPRRGYVCRQRGGRRGGFLLYTAHGGKQGGRPMKIRDRILIIEDEVAIADLEKDYLELSPGVVHLPDYRCLRPEP